MLFTTLHKNRLLSIFLVGTLFFWLGETATAQYKGGPVVDKIVARVDNQILLKSEVELAFLQARSQNQGIPSGTLKCKVFEQLLINKMMLAKAELDSVTVEDNMVDDQLSRRMNYMIQTIGSKEKLEEYYKKSVDQLKSELKKEVKDQMVVQKVQEGITKSTKVTPNEVKRFFQEIPKDSLPFFSTEVEVGQIVMFAKVSRTRKLETRNKLEELKKRIEGGEDFEIMAKAYSQDPGSAKEGGNLGFWGKGAMVPEYESAAMKLEPMGLSDIVESPFGFHLIQLIEKRGNEYNSRHILLRPESGEEDQVAVFERLDSLRSALMSDTIRFEDIAKTYSEDKETSSNGGFFTDPQTGVSRIPTENLDPGIFFTIDTLKPGSYTRPLPFKAEDNKKGARILYYKSRILPHEANLKQDYPKIQMAALEKKKGEAIKNWFRKTKSELFISRDKDYSECDILKDEEL